MKKILLHSVGYIAVAGLFFMLGGWFRDYDVARRAREEAARSVKFHDVPVPRLASMTLGSSPWNIAEQKGKVVVLEVWATWCPPCVEAIPSFRRLYGHFKDRTDFELVGVSLDGDVSLVKQFCITHGIDWVQLVEPKKIWDNSVAMALDVKAVPLTCVIDKKGIIRMYNHFPGNLEPFVESLLSERNQTPPPAGAAGSGSS